MTKLPQMSLLFLVENARVLLGRMKRGFGEGKLTGIGGRREDGESTQETAVREAVEEVSVTPLQPQHVSTLDFMFPHEPLWSQQVHVYTCDAWEGKHTESEEIAPAWFDVYNLPFHEMWSDAKHWLPQVLKGETLKAEVLFTPNLEVDTLSIREGVT